MNGQNDWSQLVMEIRRNIFNLIFFPIEGGGGLCDDDDDDDDADDDRSSCWPQKETNRQLGRGQKKKTSFGGGKPG